MTGPSECNVNLASKAYIEKILGSKVYRKSAIQYKICSTGFYLQSKSY